jgi:hypothetical protein
MNDHGNLPTLAQPTVHAHSTGRRRRRAPKKSTLATAKQPPGATMSRTTCALVIIAATLTALPSMTRAQSVCVSCDSPAGSYNCRLDPAVGQSAGKRAQRLLQLACIQDIAKRFGHEACRVRRGAVGPCTGEPYTISLHPPDANAPPSPYQARPATDPGQQRATRPAKPRKKDDPPKTVVELAEKAGKDSQKQLQKAGKAVGRAVSKTWRCVTSLFGDC